MQHQLGNTRNRLQLFEFGRALSRRSEGGRLMEGADQRRMLSKLRKFSKAIEIITSTGASITKIIPTSLPEPRNDSTFNLLSAGPVSRRYICR